jgi:ABC-2 type transport system ATP-binding protein
MFLQIAGTQDEVSAALSTVPGVSRVAATTSREGIVEVEVDSEKGRDVRRDLAAVVVGRGLGLLELRPMRMSLEDIFLSLTTEETAASTGTSDAPHPDATASSAPADSEAAHA